MKLELKIPPVLLFFISALSMYFVQQVVKINFNFAFTATLSIIFAILGSFLALFAVYLFIKAKTTVNPHRPNNSSSLVTTGIYRITRNPMYVGLLLLLISFAIYLSNPINIIVLAFFVLYINQFQIKPEEKYLQKLFGEEFKVYKKKVRRWL